MTLEEVKAIPIREVAEKCNVSVGRKGYCLCPAHNEKTPSCRVYDKTNTWYCFGCHEHGDGIDFVKAALNCDFERAFEFLGGTHGRQRTSDKIKAYRIRQEAKKHREAKEREQNAKREMHKEIHELKKITETAEPFSDEWCAAVEESERLKVELGLYDD